VRGQCDGLEKDISDELEKLIKMWKKKDSKE